MSGLLREALWREKSFDISLPQPTQTYIQSLSLLASPGIPASDHPWMPHANERHCCGFNANQYCANIHLRRWLRDERGAMPTLNATSGAENCWGNAQPCMNAAAAVITENKPENKYNGNKQGQCPPLQQPLDLYVLKKETISDCHAWLFFKTSPPVERSANKKKRMDSARAPSP